MLSSLHFSTNEGDKGLVQSPRDWKIPPNFLEIDPTLVKITMRVRRSRLLVYSENEVGAIFGPRSSKVSVENVILCTNQGDQGLV